MSLQTSFVECGKKILSFHKGYGCFKDQKDWLSRKIINIINTKDSDKIDKYVIK